jgi:translation initiation factor eIF-2B subunit delta
VIVVDARPHLEGKEMLQRLVKEGVECTYVLLPALSYVMKGVKKVLLPL